MKYGSDDNICSEVDKSPRKFIPMAPEIVQTSSFYYNTYDEFLAISDDEKNNFVYTRGTNPTTLNLEETLAELEHAEKCKVFASGMGAISATIFSLLNQGDHILMINTVYGEAVGFARDLARFGVETERVDVEKTIDIKKHIKPNTRMIYFESPSSQKFQLLDLEEVTRLAKEVDAYTVIDATWASPINQHPLDYGIDIVIHSLSKYVGGHSDVVGGCVLGTTELVDLIFERGHQALGAVNSPFDSWLSLRGLRTLPVRMKHFNEAIQIVIDGIKDDGRINRIYHPYVADAAQQELVKKYLKGYGSLFSFDLVDLDFDKLKVFVNSLEVISIGVSWGGFESLVLPAYKGNNLEKLNERGLLATHIRMFVGLEDPETIVADIKQALTKAYGPE